MTAPPARMPGRLDARLLRGLTVTVTELAAVFADHWDAVPDWIRAAPRSLCVRCAAPGRARGRGDGEPVRRCGAANREAVVSAGAAQADTHRCRIPGCGQAVPLARLMCRPHWYQVPKPLRDRIWATWRSGAGVFDPEYREAVRQAVEADGLLGTGPAAVRATQVTRQIINLAFEAGLNPTLNRSAARHGTYTVSKLHRQVATIVLHAVGQHGFALAGGNALIAHGIVEGGPGWRGRLMCARHVGDGPSCGLAENPPGWVTPRCGPSLRFVLTARAPAAGGLRAGLRWDRLDTTLTGLSARAPAGRIPGREFELWRLLPGQATSKTVQYELHTLKYGLGWWRS
jgi:hypothetical protein